MSSKKKYHCYSYANPVDFFDGLIKLNDLPIERRCQAISEVSELVHTDSVLLRRSDKGEAEVYVGVMPVENGFENFYIWKFEKKGETWLASPVPQSGLEFEFSIEIHSLV